MQVTLVPDADGYHYRGASPDDVRAVETLMAGGFTGCHPAGEDLPREGTLGGFCRKALDAGYAVVVRPEEFVEGNWRDA